MIKCYSKKDINRGIREVKRVGLRRNVKDVERILNVGRLKSSVEVQDFVDTGVPDYTAQNCI